MTAVACGLVSLVVYLATLSPTVQGGDSGEFITVAYRLGIAHPPGFPLYTMLAKLFTLLPVGTIAWRVNLFSAVCDGAAAFLLCRAVSRWTGRPWCGAVAASAFAFSAVIWPYAVTAEVFALNNLFVAGLIDLSVSATLEPDHRAWIVPLSAFWLGLGLTNHHTLVFLGLPFALYQLGLEGRRLADPRRLGLIALAFTLGLLPYLYLPIAAAARPPIVWGDQTTPSGFLTHLMRREYGTFRLASESSAVSQPQLGRRLLIFVSRFASTTFWLGPLLLLSSLVALARRRPTRLLGGLWLLALAFYLVVFSALANVHLDIPLHITIQERFWQQAVVVGSALMGVGLSELAGRLMGTWERWLGTALAAGFTLLLVLTHFSAMNLRHRTVIRNHAVAILEGLPRNTVLFTSSDETTGGVRYMQLVEGLRPDVRVIPTGLVTKEWFRPFAAAHLPGVTLPPGTDPSDPGSFAAHAFIDANIGRFPIFIVNKEPWLQTLEEAYSPWPMGLPDQVLPKATTPELGGWVDRAEKGFARFDAGAASGYREGTWEEYVATNYWKQYQRFGTKLVQVAHTRSEDPNADRLVIRALETIAQHHPAPEPAVFKNLGVAYQFLSRTDPAALGPMVRYWRKYLELDRSGDPDRAAIQTLIDQAEKRH